MIDIATLRAMAAAGASTDVILAAVEAEQQKTLDRLKIRRDKDAARQRRYRTARNGHAESHTVTRDSRDPPLSPLETPLTPPRSKPKRVSRYACAAADLPAECPKECLDFALSKGWSEPKSREEWERFGNHGLMKETYHKNYLAAWRNWVTSPYQKPVENGNAQANQAQFGGAYGASKDRFREAYAEFKAFNARNDGGESGAEVVSFLPAAGRERA